MIFRFLRRVRSVGSSLQHTFRLRILYRQVLRQQDTSTPKHVCGLYLLKFQQPIVPGIRAVVCGGAHAQKESRGVDARALSPIL